LKNGLKVTYFSTDVSYLLSNSWKKRFQKVLNETSKGR